MILNVYRPPNGNVECFIEELTQIAESVCVEQYKDVFLLGDFNIDNYSTKRTKQPDILSRHYYVLGWSSIQNPLQE